MLIHKIGMETSWNPEPGGNKDNNSWKNIGIRTIHFFKATGKCRLFFWRF